jgi:asparagine synthase (glutamine-hydrolysing)
MMALYNKISLDKHKLVLTGDGSDEIFAGYARYNNMNKFHWIPKIFKTYFLNLGVEIDSHNQLLSKLAIISTPATNIDYWYHWQQIANDKFLNRFFIDYQDNEIPIEENEFTQILTQSKSKLPISMYRDLKIWLSMESNNKLDKVSMAFSIEARSPFQSEKLIGVANREMVRKEYKIFDKKLLINQFSELQQLPTNKSKMGFVSPLGHWLRNNPSMILDNISYLKNNFDFNKGILDKLIDSPNNGNYTNFNFLWSLIVLANWHAAEFD